MRKMRAAVIPIARPANTVKTATFRVPTELKKTEAEFDKLVGLEVIYDGVKLGVAVGIVVLALSPAVVGVAINTGELKCIIPVSTNFDALKDSRTIVHTRSVE